MHQFGDFAFFIFPHGDGLSDYLLFTNALQLVILVQRSLHYLDGFVTFEWLVIFFVSFNLCILRMLNTFLLVHF